MNDTSPTISEPRWGADKREHKAHAILETLRHYIPTPLDQAVCIDIGCGSGGIAYHIAHNVYSIIGIDPEPWPRWEEFQRQRQNLRFMQESVEKLSSPDGCADIVICNQVYEHVPDPRHLISEIHRVLKPGGYCYFAGPNLLFPIEPHVYWPFVHWLPRRLAVWLMRKCGSNAVLDANSTHYWRLLHWLGKFEIVNAVPYIIRHPNAYLRTGPLWRILSFIPARLLHILTPFSPGFVFVLRKPE